MVFEEEVRPDPVLHFTGGVRTEINHRIHEVWSEAAGVAFRRLVLDYSQGTYDTARSRLTTSQLFGSDCPSTAATDTCQQAPATLYTYSDATDTLGAGGSQFVAATGTEWTTHSALFSFRDSAFVGNPASSHLGDVNGDGLPDIVRAFVGPASDQK